jgi:hypothetical protein
MRDICGTAGLEWGFARRCPGSMIPWNHRLQTVTVMVIVIVIVIVESSSAATSLALSN